MITYFLTDLKTFFILRRLNKIPTDAATQLAFLIVPINLIHTVLTHKLPQFFLRRVFNLRIVFVREGRIALGMHFQRTSLITNTCTLQVISLLGDPQRKHLSFPYIFICYSFHLARRIA